MIELGNVLLDMGPRCNAVHSNCIRFAGPWLWNIERRKWNTRQSNACMLQDQPVDFIYGY